MSDKFDYWFEGTTFPIGSSKIEYALEAWQHQQSRIDALEQENAALRDGFFVVDATDPTITDNGGDCIVYGTISRSQSKPVDEREAFELDYAKKWHAASPMAANHTIEFLCSELKEMRQGDKYGENQDYLNFKWEGWQARSALGSDANKVAHKTNLATNRPVFDIPECSERCTKHDVPTDNKDQEHAKD